MNPDVPLDTGPVSSFDADCDSTGTIWAAVADLDTTATLYRSTDLGRSWTSLFSFTHGCAIPMLELVVGSGDSSFVYVFYLTEENNGDLWVLRAPLDADSIEAFPVAVGPDTIDDFSACTDSDRLHYVYCLYANEHHTGRTGSFTRSLDFGRTWEFPQDWWNCWDPHVTYSTGSSVHCTWRYALTGQEIHHQTNRFYGRPMKWWSHRRVLGGENDTWDPVCAAADSGPESANRMWVVANFAFLDTIPPAPDTTEGDTVFDDTIPRLDTIIGLRYSWSWNGGASWSSPGTLDTRLTEQRFPDLKAAPDHPTGAVHLCYVTGTDADPGKTVVYWRTTTALAPTLWFKPMKMNNPRANVLFDKARPRLVCPPNAPHSGAGVLFSYYHTDYASGVYFDAPWSPGTGAEETAERWSRNPRSRTPETELKLLGNPVRSGAGVRLALPVSGEWDIAVYDVTGRERRSFSGSHPEVSWDGQDALGKPLAPGTYFFVTRRCGRKNPVSTTRLVVTK
ncbi:MAG: hypothetical protein JSU73_08960 [candidate division WOR-3 bacterium]|nr:MAG: hypothetical protein JSU73_08960 [candidate division WOR-3 bacterium]